MEKTEEAVQVIEKRWYLLELRKKMGLSNPKPVTIELNRLENLLKALKRKEFFKDKAVFEVKKKLKKVEEKLEHAKNKWRTRKATMRRIPSKSEGRLSSFSFETLTACPLEAEIRMYKNEIAALQRRQKGS
ncbi:hypothetical protein HPP92_020034 [Vanilla planifolia]|uniref:Uncharacterized protein n=1 Tax=Vanilla planifolia TaxID=51239 RepID=A0A835Q7W2_VANPL|nr:hypothetical protein HPP92_020034 [Vanilla planifolia]